MAAHGAVWLPAAGQTMQIGRFRPVLLVQRELRAALDQPIRKLETAAREHGEAVAGAELMFGDEHAPPAPPQLLNRHQSESEIEPEAVPGEASGPPQRSHDGIAYLWRDEHRRAVAAERVRKVQITSHVQRGGDAGGADQIDLLVAAGAGGLGRASDVAQHHDPVVRGGDVARRIGHLGELGERLEPRIKRGWAGPARRCLQLFHGLTDHRAAGAAVPCTRHPQPDASINRTM